MIDFAALSMTEIVRLQNQLQQELTRRFERHIALVFSDIVGSTAYFARFGDAAGSQLQQLHFDLLGRCLPDRGGRVVDTSGDGAFVTFPTANAATDALIEFQQLVSRENVSRARDRQLQVRMGIHWGPVLTDGVVFSGDAVNLCSRVAASAGSGEVRITREVFHELAATHRLNCRPLGAFEFKGVSRQVEVFMLDWRDHTQFATHFRIEETGEEITLPQQDLISFGRLAEHEGTVANDIVLSLPDPLQTRQISRWHFELRRFGDGFRVRSVSDGATEVDGAMIAKDQEVMIKPGSKIRVAHILTLAFASPHAHNVAGGSDATMIAGRPAK
jgi:class 3 adenylate cyclase